MALMICEPVMLRWLPNVSPISTGFFRGIIIIIRNHISRMSYFYDLVSSPIIPALTLYMIGRAHICSTVRKDNMYCWPKLGVTVGDVDLEATAQQEETKNRSEQIKQNEHLQWTWHGTPIRLTVYLQWQLAYLLYNLGMIQAIDRDEYTLWSRSIPFHSKNNILRI